MNYDHIRFGFTRSDHHPEEDGAEAKLPNQKGLPDSDDPATKEPGLAPKASSGPEWHFIHAGKEIGPLPLTDLVEKAAAGGIDADDLVKQTGGLWTKAREFPFLKQEFVQRDSREKAIAKLGQFHGIWLSKKALVICGLVLVGLAFFGIWLSLKSRAPEDAIGAKRKPSRDLVGEEKKTTDEEDADFYFRRGWDAASKGQFDSAIRNFDEAIKLNPNRAGFFTSRAQCWSMKNEYGIAIKDYNEAIRLAPSSYFSYLGRGRMWLATKDFDRAINDFDEAIRMEQHHANAYFNRGNAWYEKKAYSNAIKDYGDAIRLDPELSSAFSHRGIAWAALTHYDHAIKDYDDAIRLHPNTADFYNRGQAWYAKKDYDKAIRDFDEAIRLDPKNLFAQLMRDQTEQLRRQR